MRTKKSTNSKKMFELTGIRDYDDINECFVMADGSYFDIIKIKCHDLLNSDEETVVYECFTLLKWMKVYPHEYEVVGLNFPVDTTEQQLFFEHILERTENPQHYHYLSQKLMELKTIDQHMIEQQFYIFLFYENEQDLRLQREKTIIQLGKAGLAEPVPRFYKEMILFKINNKNLAVPKEKIKKHNLEQREYYNITDKQKAENKRLGYNKPLLDRIGVAGNISFPVDDRFILTGSGYEACIYVYEYPESLDRHWLTQLFNLNNVITSVHIAPKNMREVKKNIKKSLGEQESRVNMAGSATEVRDARQEYMENLQLYEEIKSLGEIILSVCIRLYVSAPTYHELDVIVRETIDSLSAEPFKSCIYLNEQEADWRAVYQPYSRQQLNPLCAKKGNPFKSTTLAFGDPFHFSSLMDFSGDYFGLTCSTNGPVLWDPYLKSSRRKYYNGVVWGEMGSGKSTILKKLFKSRAIRGDFIRGFDVSGEWVELVHEYGGRIIALDGSEGRINPLEVLKTSDDETTSFKLHLGKCSTLYRYLKPSATDDEIFEYEHLLQQLYIDTGLLDEKGKPKDGVITGQEHSTYPTYSVLYQYIDQYISETSFEGLSDAAAKEAEETVSLRVKIKKAIGNLISTSGDIFDGETTIEDLFDTQIVYYDIRGLARMKDTIFDAVMFSALSLAYDNTIRVGSVMKHAWEAWENGDRENGIDWPDIIHFMIQVDEFHRIVNARKIMAVEQILMYEREARKFFGGIWFASQSVNDSMPDNSDDYAVEQLKKIFELCQYKIIMQQDTSNVEKLKNLFRGEIPGSEIELVPKFETGQCILNIKSDTNILMNVFITDEEKRQFKGGA